MEEPMDTTLDEAEAEDSLFEKSTTFNLFEEEKTKIVTNEEIDFLEKYVLSVDRMTLTGRAFDDDTLDYWYWSLLNCQVRGDKDAMDKLEKKMTTDTEFLAAESIQTLLLRKSVMEFSEKTLEDVAGKMQELLPDVKLDHQVDASVGKVEEKAHPTTLQLTTQKLLNRFFSKVVNGESTIQDAFTPAAGLWLAEKIRTKELDPQQVGDVLELMENEPPDIPFLLTALQTDFKAGVAFGGRKVHEKLTRKTLELIGEKLESLYKVEAFVLTLARKLRPVSDVDLMDDRASLGKYLTSLLNFVRGKCVHNSLLGLVIFNNLRFQEEEGKGYDEKLLKEYLSIPREGQNPFKPTKKERTGNAQEVLKLDFAVDAIPELKPIGDDSAYVRRALKHFFLNKQAPSKWDDCISPKYTKPLHAEVMLTAGRGNEKEVIVYIKTLKAARGRTALKELKKRIDLEFVPSSKCLYSVEDDVELEIVTKNNPMIEVNVYKVNAKNYYKRMLTEIPNNIKLSGSCPIVDFTLESDEPSIRSTTRKVSIPQLANERGVFAVDITGNGVCLRALIRKGELRYICDQDSNSARGHVFKVFNEKNELVKEPCIWMEGKEYYADDKGDICLPFATDETKTQMIILEDATLAGSATLQFFERQAPRYKLECGMYIDREQLRNKQEATVLIRANLYMNTEIISVERLENVQLKLVCEDNMGKVRTRITPLKLKDTEETTYTFTVPTELRYVECWLTCQCEGVDLMSKQLLNVNIVNSTRAIGDMYLFPSGAAGYVLAVFGKNGEPMPNEAVDIRFTHRYFRDLIEHTVQTDDNGLCYLGKLYDVTQVDVTSHSDTIFGEQSFDVLKDMVNLPQFVNRALGATIRVPFIADNPRKPPSIYLYDMDYIESFSAKARYEGYYIVIDDLPAGDFILHVRDVQRADIEIKVSGGVHMTTGIGEYVISQNRVLELSEDMPLNIVDVVGTREKGYEVKFHGCNELTRVHIIAMCNNPCFNLFGFLSSPNINPTVIGFESPFSTYTNAVSLPAEYDYIMSRKTKRKFEGNFLVRPTLLNHGWSAQTPEERVKDPLTYLHKPKAINKMKKLVDTKFDNFGLSAKRKEGDPSSLEFLGVSSNMQCNIVPEMDGHVGTITIPHDFYSPEHNLVQVLVVDDDNTALRNIILEETEEATTTMDVRLDPGLDSTLHFAETRKVVCLKKKGEEYVIEDFATAEYEPYEGLDEPYNLYRAATAPTDRELFVKFEPLVKWLEISEAEKLEFYDNFACHEVNYYMYKKDKEFFANVVLPTIQNKTQKTFMDHYLCNDDLKKYRDLHRHRRLNTFEKILLCERLGDKDFAAKTLSWIVERAELSQLDPNKMDDVFNLGINSRQLGVEELDKQLTKLEASVSPLEATAGQDEPVEQVPAVDALRNSDMFGKEEYLSLTRKYAETTYFMYDSMSQGPDLLTPNRFWADFARFMIEGSDGGFVSQWFQLATRSMNEMFLALAVLDVPLVGEEPERVRMKNGAMKLVAKTPVILYLRELVQTDVRNSAVAVSTSYFDPEERTHQVDGEIHDKFISSFTSNKVFGCRLVVTNVSSVEQRVEILCQVPTGSIPCGIECFKTQAYFQSIPPFGTYRREFYFYWPQPGTYSHFPVHVNKNQKTVGFGGGMKDIEVTLTEVHPDTTSWKYLSNVAPNDKVLEFLATSPEALNVNLERICWRLKDPAFFEKAIEALRARKIFSEKIWAYSLISDKKGQALGEYLALNADIRDTLGPCLNSKLFTIDLDAPSQWHRDYQIGEFWPLLNPRTHDSNMEYQEFKDNYYYFLEMCAFSSASIKEISLKNTLLLVNYLLIRGRSEPAKKLFEGIDPKQAAAECPMFYDYFFVYLDMMMDGEKSAAVAQKYVDGNYPAFVKAKFQECLDVLEERKDPTMSDVIFLEEEARRQEEANKPYINFEIMENHSILVDYRNIEQATLNFYITDLEVLFSAHPFQESNTSYKLQSPNDSMTLKLDPSAAQVEVKLPDELKGNNTIIEIVTATLEAVQLYNDNSLDVQLAEDEGELRVLNATSGKPVEGAYCKVYARSLLNDQEVFYKDGYTDCRGRFDYRSLSTDQLRQTKRLSILVSTQELGSLIKECDIPLSFISQSFLPGLS